jgi:hypothetical protein
VGNLVQNVAGDVLGFGGGRFLSGAWRAANVERAGADIAELRGAAVTVRYGGQAKSASEMIGRLSNSARGGLHRAAVDLEATAVNIGKNAIGSAFGVGLNVLAWWGSQRNRR